jgi:hypothetical protein
MLPKPGGEIHFSILCEWLKTCDNDHRCTEINTSAFMPKRLIDVNEAGAQSLRLYQTKPHDLDRYLALSHPWGSVSALLTYQRNLDQHLDGINLTDLPPTIRDAVNITRALGIRYLWVDSLCIIQGSDGDYVEESKSMENIFSHAYCIIAATQATSFNSGLLNQRLERKMVKVNKDGESELYICDFIDNFETDVLQKPLHQRGWTLQDRALARRTIYLAGNQTYWECGDGIRCETLTSIQR